MKMRPTPVLLEIAVHSFSSAQAAVAGGADRIELCSALQTGGLSPDGGLLDLVMENVSLPVHALIRPRLGNFVYDALEFKTILKSIEFCRKQRVSGIVVGCLTSDQLLDQNQLKEIKDASSDLDLTFHRAIDVCGNIFDGLDLLEEIGYDRVLTSGAARSASEGSSMIREMVEYTKSYHLSIMAGAGVHSGNILDILRNTGCREIHASAKTEYPLPNQDRIGITTILNQATDNKWESDPLKIKALRAAITGSA